MQGAAAPHTILRHDLKILIHWDDKKCCTQIRLNYSVSYNDWGNISFTSVGKKQI